MDNKENEEEKKLLEQDFYNIIRDEIKFPFSNNNFSISLRTMSSPIPETSASPVSSSMSEPLLESESSDGTREEPNPGLRACEDKTECLLRRAINEGKSPLDMRYNEEFKRHIEEKHPHLSSRLSDDTFDRLETISIIRNLIRNMEDTIYREDYKREQVDSSLELKCPQCNDYFDKEIYLSCGHISCSGCVIKLEECSKCYFPIDNNLKKIIISQKEEVDDDESGDFCEICTSKMNDKSDQTKCKIVLNCKCKSETEEGRSMCISCAATILKDKSERKINYIHGFPMIDEHPTIIKGVCPICKEEPTNKQEILYLFELIPPSL
jgi:hypothetical protein